MKPIKPIKPVNPMKHNFAAIALAAVLPALLGSQLFAADGEAGGEALPDKDIIIRYDEHGVPPTFVKQDTYEYVVGERGEKYKSCEIKDIFYANRDGKYDTALKKRDEGRYTLAALYFQRALQAMPNVNWAEEYCNYGMGDAFFQAGLLRGYKGKSGTQYSPPSVYFRNALKANPKSRHILDIVCKLPQCLAAEAFDDDGKLVNPAKLTEAAAALKEAEATIKSYRDETIRIAEGYRPLAERATALLAIADARVAEKRVQAGQETMNTVKDKWMIASGTRTDPFPELKGDAVDGLLQTLVAMKEYNAAKTEADRLINKFNRDGDQKMYPLLPGAYTVIGKSNFAQAVENEGKNNKVQANNLYADARWAFLHVIAQFFDNEEYVASAHYYAGLCYDRLRDVESDAGAKAVRHWKLILTNFPKSRFKPEAEKELARVGAETPAADTKPQKTENAESPAKNDKQAEKPAAK